MYIQIQVDGELSLEEIDDFKSFSIVDNSNDSQRLALDAISTKAEDNHYWIDVEPVISLSARSGDPVWVNSFWEMLKAVEAYGYSDMIKKRVKAHINNLSESKLKI